MKPQFTMILMLLALGMQFVTAQQKTVSGTVSDENGLPLPGATVVRAGTSSGTSTDFDGKYQLAVNAGDVLKISYVGYATQSITVGAANTYNVQMQTDNTLDEVVIVGQGFEKEKKALGYSVSSVDNKEIEQRPEGDIGRILNGKVAGLNVTSSNGLSGSSTNMIIRGYSSVTQSNQPLFVVDGVPFDSETNGQFNFLNGSTESSRFLDLDPNLIANVSVLKGLSATVLYGSRGSNGVILITTKNAKKSTFKSKKISATLNQSVFYSTAVIPK